MPANKACISLTQMTIGVGVSKTKKLIKLRKSNRKKTLIKFLKKLIGSVRFQFYKSEIKKKTNWTQIEKTRKKLKTKPNKKTKSNRFESVFVLKNQTKTCRFEPVLVFLIKKFSLVIFFFYKNQIKPKIITHIFIFPS